jgi:hypothetical protein
MKVMAHSRFSSLRRPILIEWWNGGWFMPNSMLQCKLSNRFVTPGFKGQSQVHLIYASKKTTHIITECIEINVTIHQSTSYIAEVLKNKRHI